jgi:4a-hydroxytetrahydrobiopterin dehydratase
MPKTPPLSEPDISSRLGDLPDWRVEDGALTRDFKTDGWPTTLMLVNAIGYLAQAADHHPDLTVSWGSVRIALSTHTAKGITDKDFALAREMEKLALWRPVAGSPLTGTRSGWVQGTSGT